MEFEMWKISPRQSLRRDRTTNKDRQIRKVRLLEYKPRPSWQPCPEPYRLKQVLWAVASPNNVLLPPQSHVVGAWNQGRRL